MTGTALTGDDLAAWTGLLQGGVLQGGFTLPGGLAAGSYEVTVSATSSGDGDSLSADQSLTVTVAAPVQVIADEAFLDLRTDSDNVAIEGDLHDNDAGEDQDVTGVRSAGGAAPVDGAGAGVGSAVAGTRGSLVLNADGSWTYTANADSDAGRRFVPVRELRTSSPISWRITPSFTPTITVTGRDDPAVQGESTLVPVVDEGGSLVLTAAHFGNWSDPDNDVSFTGAGASNGGSIVVNESVVTRLTATQFANGEVSFVHDGREETSSTITYSVNGRPQSAIAVAITPVDDRLAVTPVAGVADTGLVAGGDQQVRWRRASTATSTCRGISGIRTRATR